MKKALPILILFLSLHSFSQNYDLFPNQSEKLFCIPITVDSYYDLSFDSIIVNNNGTTYYNYFEVGDMFESENCDFWGGPYCNVQNKASWLGAKVFKDLNDKYFFYNIMGDTLSFSFNPILDVPELFYEDSDQSFYIEYQGSALTNTIGGFDSIRSFRINHFDSNGNIIESALNDHPINISKALGLVDFFKIDLFPLQLQTLRLIGMANPDLGLQCITEANMHDHEVGDEIQYKERMSSEWGPPWDNYTKYTKYQYLEKWETNDTIHYLCERVIHYQDSSFQWIDTIPMSYSHLDTIAQIPFHKPDNFHLLLNKSIFLKDYNGLPLITYNISHQYLVYCAEDNCWGSIDYPGPPPMEIEEYVIGLGLFKNTHSSYMGHPEGYDFSNIIVYFKKFDFIYGAEVALNTNEKFMRYALEVFPQPANQRLIFKSPNQNNILQIEIFDISGKRVSILEVNGKEFEWNCQGVKAGVYFYQSEIEGINYRGKIIINK